MGTVLTVGVDLGVDVFGPYIAKKFVEAAIRDAQDLAKTIDVRIRDKSGNITAIGLPGQGGWVTDTEMDYGKKDYEPPKPLIKGPWMGPTIRKWRR